MHRKVKWLAHLHGTQSKFPAGGEESNSANVDPIRENSLSSTRY